MTGTGTPALSVRGIVKSFGAVVANDLGKDQGIRVEASEIHALVGENGAGKSTLMKIVAGVIAPDSGTVEVGGRNVSGWSTAEAIRAGVGMVHQHFMLVPTLTVAENVVLGQEPRRGWSLDLAKARTDVEALVRETGLDVAADRLVGDLPVGLAQRVEILKALYRKVRVLILDEPTAVLSPPEVADLFDVLRRLASDGVAIVLVTHKLSEVMDVSKRITVMRKGRVVGAFDTASTSPEELARTMVGRDIAAVTEAPRAAVTDASAPAFLVRDLVVLGTDGVRAVDGVTIDVQPGEIVGVAGVEGNGQTELVEAIAGLREPVSGSIRVGARDLLGLSVRDRERLGLAHIPEDRHRRGLVLDLTVAENLVLGRLDRYSTFGFLDKAKIRSFAERQIADFDIRPADASALARSLSGGNQQKIVVARELSHGFRVLVAAQPTRGVDIGAVETIHGRIRRARDEGKAVLLVSAELSEILALADRVLVLYRGRVAVSLPRSEASAKTLGPFMMGVGEAPSAHRGAAA